MMYSTVYYLSCFVYQTSYNSKNCFFIQFKFLFPFPAAEELTFNEPWLGAWVWKQKKVKQLCFFFFQETAAQMPIIRLWQPAEALL